MTETSRDIRLTAQLAEMEQRWKLVQFAKCGGHALLLLLAALAVGAALDYVFVLSITQRRLLSVTCYAAVLSYAWFGWLRPFWRPVGPRALAWMLEEAAPEFNEKLISAVEFAEDEDSRTSADLVRHILDETEVDLLKISPRRVFPLGKQHFLVPAVALIAFIVSLCIPPLKTARLIKRVVYPSISDATVAGFDLALVKPLPGARAEGDTISFVVRCTDPSIRNVKLCVSDHRVKRFTMQYDERTGLFIHNLHNVRRSIDYWAASDRVVSARHHIEVERRPKIESFTVHYRFPSHTGLPESTGTSTSGDLRAYRGSVATLEINATVPLEKMTIAGTGCRSDEPDSWQRSLPLNGSGTKGRFRFRMDKSGSYSVLLRDIAGRENLEPLVYSVIAFDDRTPTVRLDHPISDLYLDPAGSAALTWSAEDDFGIDHVELHYTVNGAGEKFLTLGAADSSYTWPMRIVQCGQGDEIAYFIRVYDASDHSADSVIRRISIVGTQRLRNAGHFVASAQSLRAQLATIEGRLNAARGLYENIRSARNHPQRVLADTLAHNLKVMREHHVRLAREIGIAESGSLALSSYGFFPRSRFYSDMMQRYFRQERLFFSDDDLDSLAKMLELTASMTDALIHKATEQVPSIQLDGIILAAASRTTPGTRAILIRQAEDIARSHNSILARDFETLSRKTVHGLRGEYYRGMNFAQFDEQAAARKPDSTRLDHSIIFPNTESFGADKPPFLISWSGFVAVSSAGVHTFFISLDGGARLFIDGRPLIVIAADRGRPEEHSAQTSLEPGLHTIHLQYANTKGNGSLALHWAGPDRGKLLLAKPALLTDHPDAFEARLRALANYINDRANDYRDLDKIAQSIGENIKSTGKRILDISRELELYNRETDWNTVRGLAEEMAAAAAATTDEIEQLKQRRDFTVIGEVLNQAVRERDIEPLRAAARAMPEFEERADLSALQAMVTSAAEDARAEVARLKKGLADKRGPMPGQRELDSALENVRAAHEAALGAATFGPVRRLKPVTDALERAEDSLAAIRSALAGRNTEAATGALAEVESAVKTAEDTVAAIAARADDARSLAHDILKPFSTSAAGHLDKLRDRLEELPGKLRNPEVTRADVDGAARDVDEIAGGLAAVAARLRAESRTALHPANPDMELSAARLAMATAVDKVRTGPITDAAAALLPPVNGTDNCTETAASAADHLQQAINAIDGTRSLVHRLQAYDNGMLAAPQRAEYGTDLARFVDEHLPVDLRVAVTSFSRLDEMQAELRQLTNDVSQLRRTPDAQAAKSLAARVDELRRRLDAILDPPAAGSTNAPPSTAPADDSRPPVAQVRDALDKLSPLMIEAEAAAAAAAKLRTAIRPDELDALRLLDEVPVEDLGPAGRQALSTARHRVSEGAFDEKARQLQATARTLGDRDPDLNRRLNDMAARLAADHAKALQVDRLDAHTARTVQEMSAIVSKLIAVSAGKPSASSIQHALTRLSANIERRDFAAVRMNIKNIDRDLLRYSAPAGTAPDTQPDALMRDGITQLQAALAHVDPAARAAVDEALRAAAAGEMRRAADFAAAAAVATNDIALVHALMATIEYAEQTVQPLKTALAEARAGRFARAASAARLTNPGRGAARLLDALATGLHDAGSRLLEAAHLSSNPNAAARLTAGGRYALAGNPAAAVASVRDAGKEGEEHLGTLQDLLAESVDAMKALDSAEADANREAAALRARAEAGLAAAVAELAEGELAAKKADDKETQAALAARRVLINRALAHLRQGDAAQAAQAVQQAAGGSVEAADAARKFSAAAALETTTAPTRAAEAERAEALRKGLVAFLKADGAPAAELVATASKAITTVQQGLAAGTVDDGTLSALNEAATALGRASQALVRVVLSRRDTALSSGTAAAGTGSTTGGNGSATPVTGGETITSVGITISDPWTGTSGALSGGDRAGLKADYNEYYRKAIQTYFESIPKRRQ